MHCSNTQRVRRARWWGWWWVIRSQVGVWPANGGHQNAIHQGHKHIHSRTHSSKLIFSFWSEFLLFLREAEQIIVIITWWHRGNKCNHPPHTFAQDASACFDHSGYCNLVATWILLPTKRSDSQKFACCAALTSWFANQSLTHFQILKAFCLASHSKPRRPTNHCHHHYHAF